LHRLIAPALPGAFRYSITSSAAMSNLSGTSWPNVLAVYFAASYCADTVRHENGCSGNIS
jgi:hypothetical protein